MDNINAIRMLVRVVEAGSFSAAGRQTDMAPSSVSRLIAELEEDLGVQLFLRTTRRLNLTEAGQEYYQRCKQILNELDEARLSVTHRGKPSGILRITAPNAISRELLISIIPGFLETYPGVKIVLTPSDYIVDLVATGVDIAIRVGRLSDSSLKARKLGDSRRVVCASPAYLKKHGTPKHPSELSQHNCLTFRDHPGSSIWQFREGRKTLKVATTGNFFARGSDAVIAGALSGMGIILMPDWNMLVELKNGQLKTILQEYSLVPDTSPVWAVHSHQRHVPPKIRAFIDYTIEQFKKVMG